AFSSNVHNELYLHQFLITSTNTLYTLYTLKFVLQQQMSGDDVETSGLTSVDLFSSCSLSAFNVRFFSREFHSFIFLNLSHPLLFVCINDLFLLCILLETRLIEVSSNDVALLILLHAIVAVTATDKLFLDYCVECTFKPCSHNLLMLIKFALSPSTSSTSSRHGEPRLVILPLPKIFHFAPSPKVTFLPEKGDLILLG
ncbi:hypothetical protein A2U01_0004797, partial [Trifolium medium]|nr:hypothetical protein [Trifolium medium]